MGDFNSLILIFFRLARDWQKREAVATQRDKAHAIAMRTLGRKRK
jgi:hypothetical protein